MSQTPNAEAIMNRLREVRDRRRPRVPAGGGGDPVAAGPAGRPVQIPRSTCRRTGVGCPPLGARERGVVDARPSISVPGTETNRRGG